MKQRFDIAVSLNFLTQLPRKLERQPRLTEVLRLVVLLPQDLPVQSEPGLCRSQIAGPAMAGGFFMDRPTCREFLA